MNDLKEYAEKKAMDYIRRNIITETEAYSSDNDIIENYWSEWSTCMDLFIAGYIFAEGLNDLEDDFIY